MGRSEFKCTFSLINDSHLDPTLINLKNTSEALGLKVILPMSHGDPIFLEYHISEAPTNFSPVKQTAVAATAPTFNAKVKRAYKKKKK